jgi:hypothetical protein
MLFIVIIILIYMFTKIKFPAANKNVSLLLDILQLK